MSEVSVAERRKCAICGEAATKQVTPDAPAYAIRRYSDAYLEREFIPREVTVPQDFCTTHFNEVLVLGTRHVGFCVRCKAWRPTGGACTKCGSALMMTSPSHRWSR